MEPKLFPHPHSQARLQKYSRPGARQREIVAIATPARGRKLSSQGSIAA
ncbi:hypothetical protein [Kamptonema formosum]|nr:hypothetical protein [Oscillatoria sp. PCC 10802]